MFTQLKNIDTAFRHIKLISALVIIASMLFSGFITYKSFQTIRELRQTVWVLSGEDILEARAAARKVNLPVEARGHVKHFHELFFSLDPDEEAIAATVGQALYLADGSAARQHENRKESGYYSRLIAASISHRITVDSIQLNMAAEPYYFKCFATEQLVRTSSVTTRRLVTEGFLRNVARTDHNRHGFLIEEWKILSNPTIANQPR